MEDTAGPPPPSGPLAHSFGPFVVDPVRRVLTRGGRVVPITAKTFDVLLVLIEHRGRIVGKDEIISRVWPDTVVQENNLVRQISSLRRALDQRPDQHDYIVTIPGQGYRFVARVQDIAAPEPEPSFTPGAEKPAAGDAERIASLAAEAQDSRERLSRGWSVAIPIGATLLAVAAMASVVLVWTARSPEGPRRALERVTFDESSLPRESSWSPQGDWVVYASDRSGRPDLWKQRVGDPNPVRLTFSEAGNSQPDWSPDGRSIVFRSERDGGGLYVMSANGGDERRIASFGYEPRWSPDGTRILFRRSITLPGLPGWYVVGLDGRAPRQLEADLAEPFTSIQASWHPDGQRVSIWGTIERRDHVFLTTPLGGGATSRAVLDEAVRRNLGGLAPGRFVWAPSRRFIYFEARAGDTHNIWRIHVDPASERWIAGPERLTTGATEESDLSLSSDGTRLLFSTRSSSTRLWAFPFDAIRGRIVGQPRPITAGGAGEVDFDARADGSKLAYRVVRAGRSELWERSIAEGRERLLVSSADWRYAKPRWSPDGAKLAYSRRTATEQSSLAVAVMNADGSGDYALTQPREVEMQGYDWAKDGSAILGACRFSRAERYATCLVPVSTAGGAAGPVRVVASDPKRNLFNQRFSPNQGWISFLAHDLNYASTSTVYVTPATGGRWTAITEGTWFDDKPRWGPNGRMLYFVSNRTGIPNVWARRFDPMRGTVVGEPFQVTSFSSAQFTLTARTAQMDIAITATHLLLPMSESRGEIWMLEGVER